MPGKIRIFDDKHLLKAVETVRRFPPLLFQPGSEPTQSEESEHKLLHVKQVDDPDFYGTVQMKVQVNEKGKATKASVLDSDDRRVEHTALEFARGLKFAPEQTSSARAPFSWVFFVRVIPSG